MLATLGEAMIDYSGLPDRRLGEATKNDSRQFHQSTRRVNSTSKWECGGGEWNLPLF